MLRTIKITFHGENIALLDLTPILAHTHIRYMRSGWHNLILQDGAIRGLRVVTSPVGVDLLAGAGELAVDVKFL
jgi:hypothetical protein